MKCTFNEFKYNLKALLLVSEYLHLVCVCVCVRWCVILCVCVCELYQGSRASEV